MFNFSGEFSEVVPNQCRSLAEPLGPVGPLNAIYMFNPPTEGRNELTKWSSGYVDYNWGSYQVRLVGHCDTKVEIQAKNCKVITSKEIQTRQLHFVRVEMDNEGTVLCDTDQTPVPFKEHIKLRSHREGIMVLDENLNPLRLIVNWNTKIPDTHPEQFNFET